MSDEIPAPVDLIMMIAPDWIFNANVESTAMELQRWFEGLDLDPQDVRVVTHLGPGIGQETQALLEVFPGAQIHAIDYYDRLKTRVKQNPRVSFHKGLFVNILRSGEVTPSDVVFISNVNIKHGFNRENVGLLTALVGTGILIARGDNGNIESEIWFQDKFKRVSSNPVRGEGVYRVRNH